MKSKLFHEIQKVSSSLHSNQVCVLPSETSALISISAKDHISIYEYTRRSEKLVHLRDAKLETDHHDYHGSGIPPNLCSSTLIRSNSHVCSIDVSGCIYSTPLNDNADPVDLHCRPAHSLKFHFQRLHPAWADILSTDDALLVSHGTLRTIHALTFDGNIIDYIKLGTYSASMATLTNMTNVVATVEGTEVVLYDMRMNNHTEGTFAQRFYVGKDKLLTISEGSLNEIIASGYSRSLAFVDMRAGRIGPQMATKTKYEINFVHSSSTNRDIVFLAGTDAEMKVLDVKNKNSISTLYADDGWCGRPTAEKGIFAGVSWRGSLLVADMELYPISRM